jgi:N-acetylglucosamine-6-phosphate deacetylase
MATWVPAGVAGIASRTGSIEPGKDADLALLHPDFAVAATIVGGEVVYQRDEG